MVNRDIVAVKLAELADRIQRVRLHAKPNEVALAGDRDALDLVAFNLMLAVQICADIASHIVADEGWPAAKTLAEGFAQLSGHGVISKETCSALSKAVGLRNVVAHGYAGINPAMVHAAATAGVNDLDSFAREIAGWIARPPAG
jgi:uncharacterized protein YutE (UPF0331/DUF86 family)